MKVLIASHQGYPWGGLSEFIGGLVDSGLKDLVELSFVETSKGKKTFSSTGSFGISNILLSLFDVARFTREVITQKPTIVHITTAYSYSLYKHGVMVLIAKALKKKVILAPHCSMKKIITNKKSIYNQWAIKIISYCDALVVLSKEWLDIKGKVKNKHVFYLQNAIDLTPYVKMKRARKKCSESIGFLYLGHIGQQKGVFDLVDALKLIKNREVDNFELHIYGESLSKGEEEKIQIMVEKLDLGKNIFISHPIFGQDKFKAFQEADIYVLPSYHEGMPISIIEAMGAALPVIATNVGGIPDLVEHNKTGLLVSPGDTENLANAMINLLAQPDLRHEMGLAGRLKVLVNNDIEKYALNLVAIYKKIAFT